ncbi:lysophosphatidic acid receptor 6-like [Mercenaria mercenaria]|uniref:lysophosphatidic acid receptor 6-like n=1 Tax=Mercenaria mercenaria TaxID=6596 RepID=UPI00234E37D9|nr:lysophosphatidic acid receptor 6-like [Mercenaria mercenaria]
MANTSNTTTTYSEYEAEKLIWKIVPPILLVLGTVGNCLSILVLTRGSIRSSTTALFLTVLAFSDLVVLYSGLLRQWLIHLFDTDVRKVSPFGCKLNIWLVYCSLDFSAWILIVVTLERVISAWLPHRARTLCTTKSAISLLISVGVFILALNAHMLYGMVFKTSTDENNNIEYQKCVEIDEDYSGFFNVTWPWIDFCAFCLIPFTVIVIGNALILFKVINSQRKVKSRIVPTAGSGNRQQTTSSHSSKQSSMTAMLFTLNIVFLISTSPISVYNICYPFWTANASEHDYAQLALWWAVVNMLMYVNNSLNFILYCLSGSKFRLEVKRIFHSLRQRLITGNRQITTQSNYTRTKVDHTSPPSPGHSGNKQFSNSKHQKDVNGVETTSSGQKQNTKF